LHPPSLNGRGTAAPTFLRQEEPLMEIEAAKMIGAGLAAIGLAGVGVGIGNVFATTIATIGRNPSIQNRVAGLMWIGFALVEAIGLFALLVAFMVLFG
jgi:F0F1-type ATP synthase membrane subunit c/vacuolar-type H+-ATPase subunit K